MKDNDTIHFTKVLKEISPKSSKYFLTSNQSEQFNSEIIISNESNYFNAELIFNFAFRLTTISDWVK